MSECEHNNNPNNCLKCFPPDPFPQTLDERIAELEAQVAKVPVFTKEVSLLLLDARDYVKEIGDEAGLRGFVEHKKDAEDLLDKIDNLLTKSASISITVNSEPLPHTPD